MNTYLNKLKEGIMLGAGMLVVLATGVFAYQYSSYLDVPDSSSGSTLTAASYNQLLANVRDLNTRVTDASSNSNLVGDYIIGNGTNTDKIKYFGGGSSVTSLNIDNLNCNTAGGYTFVINQYLASNTTVYAKFNNISYTANTLGARWWMAHNATYGSSVVGQGMQGQEQLIGINNYTAPVNTMSEYRLLCDNSVVTSISEFIQHTASVHFSNYISTRIFSVPNITSITFTSNIANGILAGTKITVYKLR